MSVLQFQPYQIVYVECDQTRLYAEVIQVILERQTCWARPLGMVTVGNEPENTAHSASIAPPCYEKNAHQDAYSEKIVHDLRQASDLLLPMHLFQPALDLEVLPLLAQPLQWETRGEIEPQAQRRLNQFVRQLWEKISTTQ